MQEMILMLESELEYHNTCSQILIGLLAEVKGYIFRSG